jgi:hypothetical protein
MKVRFLFVTAGLVLAVLSSFTGKKQLAAGDYLSFNDGTCHNLTTAQNQSACQGSGNICTIQGITYYENADCDTPLHFTN